MRLFSATNLKAIFSYPAFVKTNVWFFLASLAHLQNIFASEDCKDPRKLATFRTSGDKRACLIMKKLKNQTNKLTQPSIQYYTVHLQCSIHPNKAGPPDDQYACVCAGGVS